MARNVCLVGAGYISDVHASAIRTISNLKLQAVIDPNTGAAEALARAHKIPAVYQSIEHAIAAGSIGAAHVLTPPDRHAEAALPFLRAGIPVLVEKPLGVSVAQCEALMAAARDSRTVLGVNQNFVYHPAFVQLRRALHENRLGRPQFAQCLYNVPLRQMAARQFGHWMFGQPANILLEQAVHPLSQLAILAGHFEGIQVKAGVPCEISPGVPFHSSIGMMLHSAALPCALRLAVGQEFPFWQVSVICDDGVAVADMLNNRFFVYQRTRWLEASDLFLSGMKTAWSIAKDSVINLTHYGLSTVKLRGRNDGFFLSMRDAIDAFHQALDRNVPPELDGVFGTEIVRVCEAAAKIGFNAPVAVNRPRESGAYDIAVIGGTGFIGAQLVKRLVQDGKRVGVMARNVRNLAPVFFHENVILHRGDVRRKEDVARFIGNVPIVVGLAHGGGGKSYAEIREGMVGGAETIARACVAQNVRRFLHVGSIASLYLGPQRERVTGATPCDPQSERRADYARAKAECDRMLLAMQRDEHLPVCILRPGLVVGEGSSPFHSGLGFFNNEQHCMGWNAGRNPLPFVLVEDVAEAIALACAAPAIEGRAYNLIGDVRLSARDYIAELSRALQRPLRFHPHSPTGLWLGELFKWLVKRVGGRKAPLPSRRDLLSRGLVAQFDCSDAKRALGWQPTTEREVFIERAIRVHARP